MWGGSKRCDGWFVGPSNNRTVDIPPCLFSLPHFSLQIQGLASILSPSLHWNLPAHSPILQYRMDKGTCVHRMFDAHNNTQPTDGGWLYATDTALHEMLLQSKHRTLDPEVGASALPVALNFHFSL